MAKVLEEREKRMDREKREKERDKETFGNRSKRYKGGGGQSFYNDSTSSPSDNGAYQAGGRGGYGHRGRGGNSRGGKISEKAEVKCYLCGQFGHFFKQCPQQKK